MNRTFNANSCKIKNSKSIGSLFGNVLKDIGENKLKYRNLGLLSRNNCGRSLASILKHTIVILAITALLGLNVSCTKIVRLSAEEAEGKSQDKILEIGLSSEIKGIVLSTRELITFDSLGGQLDKNNKIVKGKNKRGESIELDLDDVLEVQVSRNAVIVFDKIGGVFDTRTQLITGSTLAGREVEIPLEEMLYLKVKRFDVSKSVLAIAIPAVIILYVINNPPELFPEGLNIFGSNR